MIYGLDSQARVTAAHMRLEGLPDEALDAFDLRGTGYHVKFARNLPAVKILRNTFGSDVGYEYWVSRVS